MSAEELKPLRLQLAEAEIAEQAAEDAFTVAKAQAEVQVQIDLERSTITRMTEAAQKRWIMADLPKCSEYVAALTALRTTRAEVLRLRAQLDTQRDARQDRELDVQRRMLDLADPAQLTVEARGRTAAARAADSGRVHRTRAKLVLRPTSRTPAFNDVEHHR